MVSRAPLGLSTGLARHQRKTMHHRVIAARRCTKTTNRLEETRWSPTSHLAENNNIEFSAVSNESKNTSLPVESNF